jgi:hypothetical protein
VNQAQRDQLQSSIRRAAKRASRNPGFDTGLVQKLTEAGMEFLDTQTERLDDALAAGDSAFSIARQLYGRALTYLLDYRKANIPTLA